MGRSRPLLRGGLSSKRGAAVAARSGCAWSPRFPQKLVAWVEDGHYGGGDGTFLHTRHHHRGIPVPWSFQLCPLLPTFNQGLSTLTHPSYLARTQWGADLGMGGSGDQNEAGMDTMTYITVLQCLLGLRAQVQVLHSVTSGQTRCLWGRFGYTGPHCVMFPDLILFLDLQMERSSDRALVCSK